jgi:glycosyltransferase involved in cell wall biosynthesis
VNERWLSFHYEVENQPRRHNQIAIKDWPKVAIGISHYERPNKLADAVQSAIWQTYPNLEIVVVDDGSTNPETLADLSVIEQQLKSANGRFIRQENLYLGAARNTAARETKSDYLCFLDDDNILLPNAIETFVKVSLQTNADIVNSVLLTMAENRRAEAVREKEHFDERVRYLHLAGPLSLMPIENVVGDATALIRRDLFDRLGGYSELRDVGYEDYEFFARAMQAGAAMEFCPKPLYFYESDRPSMITTTSAVRNFKRVFDALNFAIRDDDWRDSISLMVAQRGATVEREHLEYAEQFNPIIRDLRFLRWTSRPEDALPALVDYAEVTSSPAARRAFSNALKFLHDPLAIPPVEATQAVKQKAVIAVDLPNDWHSLKAMLNEKLPNLRDEDCTLDDFAHVFGAAYKIGDIPTAHAVFLAALKRDETEYLISNPKVNEQIWDGEIADALHHYSAFGQRSDPDNFKTLQALCIATVAVSGLSVKPLDLEAAILGRLTAAS